MSRDLPWLAPLKERIDSALASDRLPHAVWLQVTPGLGGERLAKWIAARIFCTDSTRKPCGQCLACRRVELEEHPDLMFIRLLEESKEIKVDQIRELASALSLTSHGGGRKVAILSPADKLNRNAANALLKTLEEPPGEALLLLVGGDPSRVPATVRSRCLRLELSPPDTAQLVEWLRRERGGGIDWAAVLEVLGPEPLQALEADAEALDHLQRDTRRVLDQALIGNLDPVAIAELWGKDEYLLRVRCIEAWLAARIRESTRQRPAAPVTTLFEALDEAREARQWADTPLNKPLIIERLLWRLRR